MKHTDILRTAASTTAHHTQAAQPPFQTKSRKSNHIQHSPLSALLLFLLGCCGGGLSCFLPSPVQAFSTLTRHGRAPLSLPMSESTTNPQQTMDHHHHVTTSEHDLPPNWRVITPDMMPPKDAAPFSTPTAQALLSQRAPWSHQCYQDAWTWHETLTQDCQDLSLQQPLQQALDVLGNAHRLYGSRHVLGSFNGGKDACVILELMRAAHAHAHRHNDGTTTPVRPRVVYWDKEGEFPEVLQFVQDNVERYDLDMICFAQGISFADGLRLLVEHTDDSTTSVGSAATTTPLAFCLGTRSSDPNAHGQGIWEPSSASFMPPFMRVNPILQWDYGLVWQLLRSYPIPLCDLYEQGYTSLGTVHDTLRNPALRVMDPPLYNDDGEVVTERYRAAWMLTDYSQERAGRIPKAKLTTSKATPTKETSTTVPKEITTPPQPETTTTSAPPPSSMASDISYGSDTVTQRTVGLLIIGDEILKGYTADANSQAAALALGQENVALKRIVVVSDDLDDIVAEIHRLQSQVDVIVTSGGVGPTHDDVTIKSVAAALNCEMVLHKEMAQFLRDMESSNGDQNGDDVSPLTEAQIKMATLPSISKLRYLSSHQYNQKETTFSTPEQQPEEEPKRKEWPVLQCRNIFILPGVPEYFASKIASVAAYLSCQLERSSGFKVVLSAEENSLVPFLNQVVERHPLVSFGSYPFVNQPEQKTVITVEGKLITNSSTTTANDDTDSALNRRNSQVFDPKDIETCRQDMEMHVQRALDDLIATLPSNCVIRVDVDDMILF